MHIYQPLKISDSDSKDLPATPASYILALILKYI
jgi:hypothetical protein